jgi:hypothetical protein
MDRNKILRYARKALWIAGMVSIAVNVVVFSFSAGSGDDYLIIPRLVSGEDGEQLAAACVVTVPVPEYGMPLVSFGTISFALKEGDTAYLQVSVLQDKRQSFTRLPYMCDRSVIEVTQDRRRTIIKAIAKGETLMEVFDEQGNRIPVCHVTVQ